MRPSEKVNLMPPKVTKYVEEVGLELWFASKRDCSLLPHWPRPTCNSVGFTSRTCNWLYFEAQTDWRLPWAALTLLPFWRLNLAGFLKDFWCSAAGKPRLDFASRQNRPLFRHHFSVSFREEPATAIEALF
jgi:hypothetical protein